MLHRRPQLLRGFDADLGLHLAQEMALQGVSFRWDEEIQSIDRQEDGLHLQLKSGEQLVVDCVMYATGRVPLTEGLGLDKAGVRCTDKGRSRWIRASAPMCRPFTPWAMWWTAWR